MSWTFHPSLLIKISSSKFGHQFALHIYGMRSILEIPMHVCVLLGVLKQELYDITIIPAFIWYDEGSLPHLMIEHSCDFLNIVISPQSSH